MRLNVKAFALTCALLWGLGLFFITWWIILFEGQQAETGSLIARVYRGFAFTTVGSLIGFAWAFVDGLIGGMIFAWLYNLLARKMGSAATSA